MLFIQNRHFLMRAGARLLWVLLFVLPPMLQAAPEIFTLNAPESSADPRKSFNVTLLDLALEKTRAEYGDYRIDFAPTMNTARALEEARNNTFPNLMVLTTFQNKHLDAGLDYARFPFDLGMTGYRICFVSPHAKTAVSRTKTLDSLRMFSIGQGIGWADVDILRYNKFKVEEVALYESLFRMVTGNRIDLFCRGINELEAELKSHEDINNLDYDRTFALAYTLPRVILSNKQNGKALERITKGLLLANKDGSLRKIWLERFQSALQFAKLPQRRIFRLETPNIDRIDFDYKKYYLDPFKGM